MKTATVPIGRAVLLCLALLPGPIANGLVLLGFDQNSTNAPVLPGASDLPGLVAHLHDTNTPGFLATPVGPRHFLTAAHLGFGPGDRVVFRGRDFQIVTRTNVPGSDLAVGAVDADFPAFVPLYPRDDELHRAVVVLGNGRWKGDPVMVKGALAGWRHGESGPPGIRWGTNVVARLPVFPEPTPDGLAGYFLAADFDRDAGDDEVHLTYGDSGSPVFIADCGEWKLAGIGSAVDGPFRLTESDDETPFLAALFEAGGLYEIAAGQPPLLIPDTPEDAPTSWYAARVARYATLIRELIGQPAVSALAKPVDVFVPRNPTGQTIIPLDRLRPPGVDGAPDPCVEESSRGGAPVRVEGNNVEYGEPPRPLAVDSFRFVVRDGAGRSAWSTVFVLDPMPASAVPQVLFDPAGVPVVVWPQPPWSVEAMDVASDPEGPWTSLPEPPAIFGDRVLAADLQAPGMARRFYRLRGS